MSQVHVKRKRADWSDKNLGIFLKVRVEEVRAGNRPHIHFTRTGWANIQAKFNNATKLAYDYKKFKNKWDHLKVDWALWTKLNARESGLGWDATKRTVAASDEWWEAKIKDSLEVGKFRDEAKWKILGSMPSYDLKTQNKIITACMALHNFIRRNDRRWRRRK
ncbi:L10-interacting MYB domain-containing protein-like [Lotus japonicus]|uniref:L10-interacting MYB domain-containing protein-like n=1 Tax=Lotus japonicus TaxID=34305 RepID=UPI00258A40C1|nr:L10-interacting MYB domain-containing protein-like [Lotus japonicus]